MINVVSRNSIIQQVAKCRIS